MAGGFQRKTQLWMEPQVSNVGASCDDGWWLQRELVEFGGGGCVSMVFERS